MKELLSQRRRTVNVWLVSLTQTELALRPPWLPVWVHVLSGDVSQKSKVISTAQKRVGGISDTPAAVYV